MSTPTGTKKEPTPKKEPSNVMDLSEVAKNIIERDASTKPAIEKVITESENQIIEEPAVEEAKEESKKATFDKNKMGYILVGVAIGVAATMAIIQIYK